MRSPSGLAGEVIGPMWAPLPGWFTSIMLALNIAVGGAIAFSGKAIIVKLAYRYGVDAVTLLMLRMLFALPLFVLMAWWASRGQPSSVQVTRCSAVSRPSGQ